MPKKPQPWWRSQTGSFYTTIDGKQIRLGADKKEAHKKMRCLRSGIPSHMCEVNRLSKRLLWLVDDLGGWERLRLLIQIVRPHAHQPLFISTRHHLADEITTQFNHYRTFLPFNFSQRYRFTKFIYWLVKDLGSWEELDLLIQALQPEENSKCSRPGA